MIELFFYFPSEVLLKVLKTLKILPIQIPCLQNNIADVPVCGNSQPVIYGVSKNELVDIVCSVEANPSEVNFKWTFNNSAELIRKGNL